MKTEIAIVNRGFWPEGQVIGEALLALSERIAVDQNVSVITQSHVDIQSQLEICNRGDGVRVFQIRSHAGSSGSIIARAFDAVLFAVFTFYTLLKTRPSLVYVATNPPVVVPFLVMVYCRMFRAKYCYHLQDIHPEIANLVIKMNRFVFALFVSMEKAVIRHASAVVTLTQRMQDVVWARSSATVNTHVIANPAIAVENEPTDRSPGFVFCGNAGRLQRIPLLLEAISLYFQRGGMLPFTFAGSGVYSRDIEKLSLLYPGVQYLGLVSVDHAAQLVAQFEWAILPIDDEVTKFAFPSKSSSYVMSGANILSVCSCDTSVAQWVTSNGIGMNVEPDLEELVDAFFSIEKGKVCVSETGRDKLIQDLSIAVFTRRLSTILQDCLMDRVEGEAS
jgi:hypothetical protein